MNNLPQWTLSEDRTEAIVDFPTVPPTQFRLRAEDVEEFITLLGRIRMDMVPPSETGNLEQGNRVEVTQQSRWYVDPRDDGGVLLAVFHPSYRWVGALVAPPDLERFIALAAKARVGRAPK